MTAAGAGAGRPRSALADTLVARLTTEYAAAADREGPRACGRT
ncbi:hypothetical protein ABZ920_20695 [Streptomyces sp. NPDC046831]